MILRRLPVSLRMIFLVLAALVCAAANANAASVIIVRSNATACEPTCPEFYYFGTAIDASSPQEFMALKDRNWSKDLPVVFNSGGGDLDAALEIGMLIRTYGLTTLVGRVDFAGCAGYFDNCKPDGPGGTYRGHVVNSNVQCRASCALAFLGGKERGYTANLLFESLPNADYVSARALTIAKMYERMEDYLKAMEYPPGLIGLIQKTPLRTSTRLPSDPKLFNLFTSVGDASVVIRCTSTPNPNYCVTRSGDEVSLRATPAQKKNPTAILMRNSDKACEPNCPEFIYVGRFISDDTAGEIEAISTRMKGKALPVVFNAPFGNAVSAMAVGRTIRKLKLTALAMEVTFDNCSPFILTSCTPEAKSGAYLASTLQPTAYCNGACMIGFAGGVTRAAVAKAFTLVSPMDGSLGQQVADDNQRYLKEIPDYFISMGLTPSIRAKLEQIGKGTTLPLDQPTAKLFKLVNSKADPTKLLSPAACRSKASAAWCVKIEGVVPPNRPELVTTSKPGKPTKPAAQPTPSYMQPMRAVLVRSNERDCEPNCPEWIQLDGQITGQSPAVVKKALAQAGKLRLPVLIRSPGGDVRAALAIGRMIRDRKLDVAVGWTRYEGCQPEDKACVLPKTQKGVYRGTALSWQAFCESACPLVMAAGQRRLSGYYASVGVHQILTTWHQERIFYRVNYRIVNGKKKEVSRTIVSRKPTKTYTTTGLYKGLRKDLTVYLNGMGVSTDIFTDMDLAPPSSIHELPLKRQQDLKLATGWENLDEVTAKKICGAPQPAENCVALPQ